MHVADPGTDHELQVRAVAGNLSAYDVEFQRLVIAFAQDGNVHVGALGALQHVRHVAHAQVVRRLAVHGNDHVTGTQANAVRRGADEGSDHDNLVVAGGNLHAHAVVFSALL